MTGAGSSILQSSKLLAGDSSYRLSAVGDLNPDGLVDLVWQSPLYGLVLWYMTGIDGTTSLDQSGGSQPGSIHNLAL